MTHPNNGVWIVSSRTHSSGLAIHVLHLGKCIAEVYEQHRGHDPLWHTFDRRGTGGENASAPTVAEAKREAFGSLLMQWWSDPELWHVGRPTRKWPR